MRGMKSLTSVDFEGNAFDSKFGGNYVVNLAGSMMYIWREFVLACVNFAFVTCMHHTLLKQTYMHDTYIHTYIHTCIILYLNKHSCTIHTYIHIYIHTYIYIHI
jgi:hypothetical protein